MSIYAQIRQMNKGDILYFPYEKWNAVRSCASYLGAKFNSCFQVIKDAPRLQKGSIKITRTL